MLPERVLAGDSPIGAALPATSITTAVPYVVAAAIAGLLEIAVDRVAAPVVSHLPVSAGVPGVARWVASAGDVVTGVAAVLIVAAVLALLLAGVGPAASSMLAVTAGITGYAVVTGSSGAAVASRTAVVVTAAGAAIVIAGRVPVWRRASIVAAVASVVFGMWPLFAADLGVSGGGVRRLAEIAFVATPILILAATRRTVGWSRGGAIVAGVAALSLLVVRPGDGALVSMWAVGTTMALPTVVYLLAAVAAGAVVGRAVSEPRARLVASALVLLAVAGLQTPALHHNLTAASSVALFCLWAVSGPDRPEEEACPECRVASS